MTKKMASFPTVRQFERAAENLLRQGKSRGEPVYGIKPWYSAAGTIENGATIAFIGANPGGSARSQEEDKRLGALRWPWEKPDYNAWLDDDHWEDHGAFR